MYFLYIENIGCRNLNGESRTNEAHEMTSKNKSVGTPPKDTAINARSNGPHWRKHKSYEISNVNTPLPLFTEE